MSSTPRVGALLAEAQALGLDRLDAQLLLGQVLGRPRTWLIAHDEALVPEASRYRELCGRRRAGEPLAYLVGFKEFHGLMLEVSPATLVPRPDTETLVHWALEVMAGMPGSAQVVDLGCGSGAIALAVKHHRPDARLFAVERSDAALLVARANGQRLGLTVDWRLGDWLAPLQGQHFDLLLSNPPYIAEGDPHLPALRYEPLEALTAGADGLDALRQLIAQAPAHLRSGGWLLLEHGHDQADAVAALFAAQGSYGPAQHRVDLGGHRRCTGAAKIAAAA